LITLVSYCAIKWHMTEQEITDTFEMLPDWDERYEFIAELGHELDAMATVDKTEHNRVQGCTTPTWVTGHLRAGDPPVLEYHADVEGTLVRGIVVLLLAPFQGKTPEEVLARDISDYIGRLELEEHLSQNRRQGMHAFIAKLKTIARACAEAA